MSAYNAFFVDDKAGALSKGFQVVRIRLGSCPKCGSVVSARSKRVWAMPEDVPTMERFGWTRLPQLPLRHTECCYISPVAR